MMANSRAPPNPLREEKMTEANHVQTNDWLGNLYADLLQLKQAKAGALILPPCMHTPITYKLRSAADAVDA